MSVATMLQSPSRTSTTSSSSSLIPVTRQNTMTSQDGRSIRQSKRFSVSALYMSMSANEKDGEIDDELAKAQKTLRDLKTKISSQSKKNFVLEKDVRYLDSRIALLIQNRIALEEVQPSRLPPTLPLTTSSKTRSPATWTTLRTCRKASFPTTRRRRNTATCSSSCNPNPVTLPICAVS